MPKDKLFTAPVCHAAAACFEVGDTIKGIAQTLDTNDMRVRRVLERGRKSSAPDYLAGMSAAYDAYQESSERELTRRRAALAKAAGLDYGGDDV